MQTTLVGGDRSRTRLPSFTRSRSVTEVTRGNKQLVSDGEENLFNCY
jgi:hypothetical protein